MKRRIFIKAITTAGIGSLIFPSKSFGLENRVSGIVTDTLSGEIVEDARVLINGEEYITDSNGEYNKIPVGVGGNSWGNIKRLFNDDPKYDNLREKAAAKQAASKNSEILKVEIKHDDYFDAVRYVNSNQNEFNIDIINKSFDMELFDMWCRSITGATQRWAEQPKWYINTSPAYGSGNEVSQDKIDLVYEIINNDLVEFTGGFINNPIIEEGENPPYYGPFSATPGFITVMWRDDEGSGCHSEKLDGNRIYSGAIRFNLSEPERRTYLHELTQVMGARGEIQNYDFIENGEYTQKGLNCGIVLHKRPIGSRSPDENPWPL